MLFYEQNIVTARRTVNRTPDTGRTAADDDDVQRLSAVSNTF